MEEPLSNFFPVIVVIVIAPLVSKSFPFFQIPTLVIEILCGILIGPQVFGFTVSDAFLNNLADLGMAFLFFLAGFEIDFERIKGTPLKLASISWILSISIAILAASLFYSDGIILNVRYVAIALTTTAIGTLLPMLRDSQEFDTAFGTYILAIGAVGEFGPIVLTALLLSSENQQIVTLLLMISFGIIVLIGIRLAQRQKPKHLLNLIHSTMNSSSQLPIRISLLILVGLISIAIMFKLEFVLGAFAAGTIVAQAIKDLHPEDLEPLRIKNEAIGFGFLIPIFFVVSGINFNLQALISNPISLLELPLFLILLLIIRGLPVLLFYRNVIPKLNDQMALALLSATGLPLLVAITKLGLDQKQMKPETAAALVGAGMMSVFIFPLVGLTMKTSSRSPN